MQPLSPKKYIETKVRQLPLHKCLVNKNWQEAGLANVVVLRRHVNDHVSGAVYLVDLKCLGVKDTLWFFNEDEEDIMDKFSNADLNHEIIDYEVAHNIVYAGHDFALEYNILPHKEFLTSRFVLEEDDDTIPLVEIKVGEGEDSKPHLIEFTNGQYADALTKLKKHAGEGNYYYTYSGDEDEWEGEGLDDDDLDEDWEMGSISLKGLESDGINFETVTAVPSEELEDVALLATRNELERLICRAELYYRKYNDLIDANDDLEDEVLEDDETSPQSESEIIDAEGWKAYADSNTYVKGTNADDYDAGTDLFKAYYAAITAPGIGVAEMTTILKNHLPKIANNLYFLILAFERMAVAPDAEQVALLLPFMKQRYEAPAIRLAMAFYHYEQKVSDPISESIINALTLQQIPDFSEAFADDELVLYFALQTIRHSRNNTIKSAVANYELLTETMGPEIHIGLMQVMLMAFISMLETFIAEQD